MRRTTGSFLRVALLLALVATLPTLAATAQQDPADDAAASDGSPSLFIDRVDVNVVNVEVFVTDKDGRAVAGLERDDFVIRVDGEPVEITNFDVGSRLRGVGDGAAAATETLEPTAGSSPQPVAEPAPEPTAAARRRPLYLVAYIDHINLRPTSQKRVLDELRTVVAERAAAGDRVMLVGYDGAVEVVQPFTTDAEALDRGIDRLARETTRRQLADSKLRAAILEIQRALASNQTGAISGIVAGYAQERANEAQRSYRALGSVVRSLGGLPGRKALLYVSDGIPRAPGAELRALLNGGVAPLAAQRDDLSRLYEAVAEAANAYEITLYTMDARGAEPAFFRSAESRSLSGLSNPTDAEFTRNTNLREPLLDMARATGGRAVFNTNDIGGALDELVTDFGAYYSLGITAEADGEEDYHRIEVEVERPGLTVRHRQGYVTKPAAERVADRTLAFLVQGWQSNPLGVELGFGEPKKRRRHWRVPLIVRIPPGAVTLLPQGERMVGELTVFIATRDDEGRSSDVTRLPQEVSVPRSVIEDDENGGLGYSFKLDLRPGAGALVVGVWDQVGGGESYVYQKFNVGE